MSNSASAIVALVVGLFIGIGLGIALARLSGAKNPSLTSQVELAKATAELTGAQTMLAEYKSQIDGERAKSDATIKLNAELEAMKTRVEELNRISVDADRRRVGAEAEIKTQITQMAAHNENLVNQTRAIAGALASSQTRGKYGEAALEQLLEGAGLIEGEHFTRQR
jgi:DNA recombination protein RmuC